MGLKSKEITFIPNTKEVRHVHEDEIEIRQSTPGSVNLVFQAILPYLLFASISSQSSTASNTESHDTPIKVRITGGTNVTNSPSVDYFHQVLIPMLEKIGIPRIDVAIRSRGWSQGSVRLGTVTYTVTPLKTRLSTFQLVDRGVVRKIKATIIAPKETESMIRDELDVMFERNEHRFFGDDGEGDIEVTFEDSQHEKRYYFLLVATTSTGMVFGRDWLYDQGVRAGRTDTVISSLVKRVGSDLIGELKHGGCVDEYLRDQLIIFQSLAEGKSQVDGGTMKDELVEPSLHAKTAQWVISEMLGTKFDERGSCKGISLGPEAKGKQVLQSPAEHKDDAAQVVDDLQRLDITKT